MEKIRFVCATRASKEEFYKTSALGRSIAFYNDYPFLELQLYPKNTSGLPVIYNEAIADAEHDPAVLVFIHDDVHLCDFYWPDKIYESLRTFDIAGVAGGKIRIPKQYSWASIDGLLDDLVTGAPTNYLSGAIGHGKGFPDAKLSVVGPSGQECKLLDGVLLFAHSSTLITSGLKFDPLFDFHFYDLDFCRQAELRGLRMGTCPISVIHESGGAYGSDAWKNAYAKYLEKYGE